MHRDLWTRSLADVIKNGNLQLWQYNFLFRPPSYGCPRGPIPSSLLGRAELPFQALLSAHCCPSAVHSLQLLGQTAVVEVRPLPVHSDCGPSAPQKVSWHHSQHSLAGSQWWHLSECWQVIKHVQERCQNCLRHSFHSAEGHTWSSKTSSSDCCRLDCCGLGRHNFLRCDFQRPWDQVETSLSTFHSACKSASFQAYLG